MGKYYSPAEMALRAAKTIKVKRARQAPLSQILGFKSATLDEIYAKVDDAVSQSFPDGDPIDYLGPWMRKNNIQFEKVDRAVMKHNKVGYHAYLAQMWDEMAGDAFSDFEHGHPRASPFLIEDSEAPGGWKKAPNPWKSS